MQNLAKMGMVAVICLGVAVGAGAGVRPAPPAPGAKAPKAGAPGVKGSGRFAVVKVPEKPLRFGEIPAKGLRRLQAKTTVRVLANRAFRLEASFGGLTQGEGQAAIPAEQMKVTINGKEVPVGTERVQIASGPATPHDGVEIPIVIEVTLKRSTFYPAGQYGGNLVVAAL